MHAKGGAGAATGNLLVRRAAFEEVGGFADGIRSGGDVDLCWRLQDAGWELERRPEATVEHHHRDDLGSFLAMVARYGAGSRWLNERRPGAAPRWPLATGLLGSARDIAAHLAARTGRARGVSGDRRPRPDRPQRRLSREQRAREARRRRRCGRGRRPWPRRAPSRPRAGADRARGSGGVSQATPGADRQRSDAKLGGGERAAHPLRIATRLVAIRAPEQHGELLAAHPGDDVGLAALLLEDRPQARPARGRRRRDPTRR